MIVENNLDLYISKIKEYIFSNYRKCFREPVEGVLNHPFLVPGSCYGYQLWDWDSWLTGVALMGIDDPDIETYQKGCVLNFLDNTDEGGKMPIVVDVKSPFWIPKITKDYQGNIHKPCLAIHILEICNRYNDVEWIRNQFSTLLKFIECYEKNQKHSETGLFFWRDDFAIGFDNDPTVVYRPYCASGAIYLNCLMVEELASVSKIAKLLGLEEVEKEYSLKCEQLKECIRNECFDEIDGYFYTVDLSLRPINLDEFLHSGYPRHWKSLPIKITTWAGMLALWSGVATKEQAKRCVEHYLKPDGLFSDYGIRSVGKNEKMYNVVVSNNPSCWTGPIWIVANYFTYLALKKYGYDELAKDIAIKTINLLGEDVVENGEFHEYYHPETGKGVHGKGFQSWNFLVLKLIEEIQK